MQFINKIFYYKLSYFNALLLSVVLSGFLSYTLFILGYEFTWDSNIYTLQADSLFNSNYLRLPEYAPLYPWLLGFLKSLLASDIIFAISVYNFILLCFYFYFCFWLSEFRAYVILLAALLINPTFLDVSRHVWTELGFGIFLALGYGSIACLRKRSLVFLEVVCFVVLAMLPLQRYIGLYHLVFILFFMLFYYKDQLDKHFLYMALAFVPASFIIFHNFLISGNFSGVRKSSLTSFYDNFLLAFDVLISNFDIYLALYFFCVVILISLIYFNSKNFRSYIPLLFLLSVFLFHVFVQVLSSSIYLIDRINPRYFVVLIPLLIVLLIFILSLPSIRESFISTLLIFSFGILVFFGVVKSLDVKLIRYNSDIRHVVTTLGPSTIGVYERGRHHLPAKYIYSERITPYTNCSSFHAAGDFENGFYFISPCNSNDIVFKSTVSLASKDLVGLDYLLVSKTKLDLNNHLFGKLVYEDDQFLLFKLISSPKLIQ